MRTYRNSFYTILEDGRLKIEDADVIFRNFRGLEKKTPHGDIVNAEGDQNFCVMIHDVDLANKLSDEQWNIKTLVDKETEELHYYLPVTVRFIPYPPRIVQQTGARRNYLDEESVKNLDNAFFKRCDIVIKPSHWTARGNSGVKAYLKTMYVDLEIDEFEEAWGGSGYGDDAYGENACPEDE